MQDFRELAVWRKAHALTLQVYAATTVFPRDEIYALTSQLRRAAVLGYLERSPYEGLSNDCVEVKRMLSALLRKLRADS